MRQLSDHLLVDVYQRAILLNLDPEFIELLAIEIKRRNLQVSAVDEADTSKTA